MKDYLNSQEIWDIIKVAKLADQTEEIIEKWKKLGNLTKDEHKWLKMALSFALKGYNAILARIKHSEIDKIRKRRATMGLYFIDKFMEKQVESQMAKNMTEMQKDERYFDLAECTIYYCCGNCTRHSHTCYTYAHFVIHCMPEPTGEDYEGKHCRYGHYVEPEREELMAEAVKKLIDNINEKNGTEF